MAVRRRIRTVLTMCRLIVSYAVFAGLKRALPLPTLVSLAWVNGRGRDGAEAARARAAVVRLRRLPGVRAGDCLQTALVLYRELSRTGCQPVLVMGMRRDAGHTAGHAWVEVDGVPVDETPGELERFTRVISLAGAGRRIGPS